MEQVNSYVLALLDAALHNRTPEPIGSISWPAVLQELKVQSIASIPEYQISTLSLSPEQHGAYHQDSAHNLGLFYMVMVAQNAVLSLLEQIHVPCVVLKGASSAMAYPLPDHRSMGDIDLLIRPEDMVRVHELLTKNGYRTNQTPEKYRRHISFENPQGIEIEVHDRFSSSTNDAQNQYLDQLLLSAIARRKEAEVCGFRFPVLPDAENGLVLLAHINQHLHGGLGLRQITDWLCFVERHPEESFWDTFLPMADRIGMKRLASVTTAMCRKYLGLVFPCNWDRQTAAEPIVDELMDYILAHGNFGRKDEKHRGTISMVRIFRNPFHGLAVAQRVGRGMWPALRKHPWLRPFAWCYQLCRWMKLGRKEGVDISYVTTQIKQEEIESDFLRRLGITRI